MNKNKSGVILLFLLLVVSVLPVQAQSFESNFISSFIGARIGRSIADGQNRKKMRKVIKACNDPLLNLLSEEEAIKVIIEHGGNCPRNPGHEKKKD